MTDQFNEVRAHLAEQAREILQKFKKVKSKELSNTDIILMLTAYKTNEYKELDPRVTDKISECMSALTAYQMAVVKTKWFSNGHILSSGEVAEKLKITERSVTRNLKNAYARMAAVGMGRLK